MGSKIASVVPANRLGQLLAEARLRQGADLEAFARRSDFTVGELSDLEAGHRSLDDSLVSEITSLYEVDCGPILPHRSELTIDLTDNKMSAAGHAVKLESAAHDHVLDRYLSLVYLLRNGNPGTVVPLRDEDLAILAASLAEREELIAEQLLTAMAKETESVTGLVAWLRRRLWVPGAGAVVGAVSIGTLVMLSSEPGAPPEQLAEPEPEPGNGNGILPVNAAAGLILPQGIVSSTPADTDVASSASTSVVEVPTTDVTTSIASTASSTSTTSTASTTSTTPTTSTTSSTSTTSTASTTSTTSAASSTSATSTAIEGSPEQIGAAAEALLPFDWQQTLPGWEVKYLGPNAGFRGLTYPYDQTIEMFVRPTDTPESLAGILAHELGHAIDVTHLHNGDREDWQDARQINGAPWWPDAYASDFQSGAGDFAEAFAYWALKDPSSSQIAGTPTPAQLAVLEQILSSRI